MIILIFLFVFSGFLLCLILISKYVLMDAGEPPNEMDDEEIMKEADRDGDGAIDYDGLGYIHILL